ncbi:hypothetical protein PG994_011281 [Apiospora phragmitis]|uniref:Cyanovirin-N domain-containing protein n=1 Tax=Apiospora phragmitis TaxID=2905665 RepID=A0ABR1TUL8_9PEZI
MKLLSATLACLIGLIGLVESQGFLGNCTWQSANLTGSFLGMYCNDDDIDNDGYQFTWFDLTPCLINNGGQLIAYDNCNNLNFTATNITFYLTAQCSDTSGHFVPTAYDLNQVLWNHNGTLGCFEHQGNATECGPQCDPGFVVT